MSPLLAQKDHYPKDYSSCSGCDLCLLVCPVWRQKKDLRHTAHGRARAFQHGATPENMGDALFSCALCGSCNTICPEEIDLNGILMNLRNKVKNGQISAKLKKLAGGKAAWVDGSFNAKRVFIPGRGLREDTDRVKRIVNILGGEKKVSVAGDDGWDIGLSFEAGTDLPVGRLERFIDSLRNAKNIVVSEGIMKRVLRNCLPGVKVTGIGEELTSMKDIRKRLLPTDLYVVESRSYNTDFERLSRHYDRLRRDGKCAFNLDLHMVAIPTTATSMHRLLEMDGIDSREQAKWILKERNVKRIVVESMDDGRAFMEVTDIPVVHLADIFDDSSRGGI